MSSPPGKSDDPLPFSLPELSDACFARLRKLIDEYAGIHLADNRQQMMRTRLGRRLRVLGLDRFDAYLELVANPEHDEVLHFVDALTTNLTYFFREPEHFAVLRHHALPRLIDGRSGGQPLRIWSAGCSSGQEPYSIAMTVRDESRTAGLDVRILCTDIHSAMVRQTEVGEYAGREMRGLWNDQRGRWFEQVGTSRFRASPSLRSMLICKRANLLADWPIKPGVDVIFCRNTIIYFEPARRRALLERMADLQRPGAFLFLGHSESVHGIERAYRRVANTVYTRV